MSRRATPLPIALPHRDTRMPAQRWLYDAIRSAILDGRLPPGGRVPSTRELAASCRLARGTVVATFDQLHAEGYIESTHGSGTRVTRILPDDLLQAPGPSGVEHATAVPVRRLSSFSRRAQAFPTLRLERPRAFRANEPALDLFPTGLWAQLAGRRLRRVTRAMLAGSSPLGYAPLRDAVAAYLRTSRGVRCTAEQVVIVSGTQEAIDLAVRVVADRGDRVYLENPGYAGAARVFEAAGLRVTPMPADDEGARIPTSRAVDARLAYVTPAHQFPTGVSMSLARRLALVEWARRARALIFEDDYDSEFRYAGRPLPALQSLDPHGVVLFSGTFSKVLFPSLRLGYIVVPSDLVDRIAAAKSLTTRHAPVLEQAVLADFMTDGHFARHIRRMREVYAERLSTLIDAAHAHLDRHLDLTPIEAGLQIAAWSRRDLDIAELVARAAREQVELVNIAPFWRGRPARAGLLLGFAAVDPAEIRRGVVALGRLLSSRPTRVAGPVK